MKKTSLSQKLLLIIFGLCLAVILLEAGLRAAGALVLYLQERHNHLSFAGNEYRILCLGESTTALGGEDSYPSQLEQMLNAKGEARKFTVINKGIISTNTNYILAHLEQNLDAYKPRMVVLMMGVNDKIYLLHEPDKSLWRENIKFYLKDLRVYKLARLLYEHITHRIKEIKAPAQTPDLSPSGDGKYQQTEDFLKSAIAQCLKRFSQDRSARQYVMQAGLFCVELAQRYRLSGRFQEAQELLKQATVFAPGLPAVYQEWGELFLAQKQGAQAIKAFQTALALGPQNSDILPGLARAYYQEHNDNAFFIYAGYLRSNPKDYWGDIELARWLRETHHDDLAEKYEDIAQGYFRKAAQHGTDDYFPITLVNYSLVLKKILSRHIKVVVMQYPLRDIGPLKNYLGQRKDVIYVENKENFKQALAQAGYSRYFKDSFAVDFGHCTREGNALIARNLAGVILKNK